MYVCVYDVVCVLAYGHRWNNHLFPTPKNLCIICADINTNCATAAVARVSEKEQSLNLLAFNALLCYTHNTHGTARSGFLSSALYSIWCAVCGVRPEYYMEEGKTLFYCVLVYKLLRGWIGRGWWCTIQFSSHTHTNRPRVSGHNLGQVKI